MSQPFTRALLLFPRPRLMLEKVGGLSVLERQLHTAHRAGIREVWIRARKPQEAALKDLRLPPLKIRWAGEAAAPCPALVLSGDHFLRVEALRAASQAPAPARAALEDSSGMVVVRVIPSQEEGQRQPLAQEASLFLDLPAGRERILAWLLASGPRSQDGFMARHFDRYLSLAVTRRLLETRVTPNAMTVLSSMIGIAGSLLFLSTASPGPLAGAGLIWLHSVLDGCDGELARIRFQESPLGGALDFWGDNLVHLSLFLCLGLGFARADQSPLPMALGLAAALGSLGSAAMAYQKRRKPEAFGAVPNSPLARLENWLAQRDFIYLLLLLAFLGRTYEFLWAAAVGSLLFFAMMIYLGRTNHEHSSQVYQPGQGQAGGPAARNGSGHQHVYSRS